jgi:hypothetical protein
MPLSTEDRLAILDLVARYNTTWDLGVPDGAARWASTFTDDGVFEIEVHGPEGLEKQTASGRAELEARYRARHPTLVPRGLSTGTTTM